MKNNKNFYYLLIVITIFVSSLSCTQSQTQENGNDGNQYENLSIIQETIGSESLFIKKAIWGVSADKAAIIISRDSSQNINTKKDLVFEGLRTDFLYFKKGDTLHLFIDTMKPKFYNKSFEKCIQIDTTYEGISKIYNLYRAGKSIGDGVKIVKF